MSSASSTAGSHSGDASAIRSCHHRSRPTCIGTSWPVRLTTTTFSTVVVPLSASSVLSLRGTMLPRRQAPSDVMTIVPAQSLMRSDRLSELKPPKTTLCGAPMRAHASMAIGSSGIIPR